MNELSQSVLKGFASDPDEIAHFLSIEEIHRRVHYPEEWRETFGDVTLSFDTWHILESVALDLCEQRFLETRALGNDRNNFFRLTALGLQFCNELELKNPQTRDGKGENVHTWRNLSKINISSGNVSQIDRMISEALDELSKSNRPNEAIMQASAYLNAAKQLLVAPSPPSALIWKLIERAAAIVGLIQPIAMIFGGLVG